MNFNVVAIAVVAFVANAVAQSPEGLKLTAEQELKVQAVTAACIEESDAVRRSDFSKVDDKVNCFAKCLGYNVNGVINEAPTQEASGSLIGEVQIKAFNWKCNVKGSDDCDIARELYRCYYTEKLELPA